jgi:hypothetical protein
MLVFLGAVQILNINGTAGVHSGDTAFLPLQEAKKATPNNNGLVASFKMS